MPKPSDHHIDRALGIAPPPGSPLAKAQALEASDDPLAPLREAYETAQTVDVSDLSVVLPNEDLRQQVEGLDDADPLKKAVMSQVEVVNQVGRRRQQLLEAYAQLDAFRRRREERLAKARDDDSDPHSFTIRRKA
jgi:hypothetical protein